jgi:hypothetical protein
MNRYLLAPVFGCAVIVAACSERTTPSSTCSDEATVSLVKQVFADGLAEQLAANNFDPVRGQANELLSSTQVRVDAIRTASRDDAVRKFVCNGELLVSLPAPVKTLYDQNALMHRVFQEQGITVDPAGLRSSIQYTAQPTDDGKQLHVQVKGHAPLSQTAFQLVGTVLVQQAEKAGSSGAQVHAENPASPTPSNIRKAIRTTGHVATGQGSYEFFSAQDNAGYGFDPDSPIGKRLLAECGPNALCDIEGELDQQSGQLVSLRELRKSTPRSQ